MIIFRSIFRQNIPNRILLKQCQFMGGSYSSTQIDTNDDMSSKEFVENAISQDAVVIFSKTTCPFCDMAKSAFSQIGVTYKTYELNKMKNCGDIQDSLLQITGARTVPRVFINGKCIGGGSETKKLHESGELAKLVQS